MPKMSADLSFFARNFLLCALLIFTAIAAFDGCTNNNPPEKVPPAKPAAPKTSNVTFDQINSLVDRTEAGDYEIYALKLGDSQSARKKQFFEGAGDAERIPVSFWFYVLKSRDKVVLVDTGFFNADKIKLWRIQGFRDPADLLSDLGIKTSDVNDIIITHKHWDHIGGLPRFKSPQVYIAEPEYKSALKYFLETDKEIADALERFSNDKLIRFTKPLDTPLPGIILVRQGAHTKNFQYVIVKNKNGIYILPSDVGPLYLNFEPIHPSGQSVNLEESSQAIADIMKLAEGRIDHVIPSHDPEVINKYPKVKPNIVRISKP